MERYDIAQIERFAPQWAAVVPATPDLCAALASAMTHRYGTSVTQTPRIRAALGLPPLSAPFAGEPHLAESLIDAVEADLDWVSLTAGEQLFRQGDAGDGAYLIVDGRLRVLAERPDGTWTPLGESGRGEMIGEMALLTGEPRSATIEALRDTNLIRISTASFTRLVERFPSSMLHIARMLVQRERRRTAGRAESAGAATFAVLADQANIPLAAFCRHLLTALAQYGATLHLTAEQFGCTR